MGDSSYSFSLTTFSPSGKLVQIEYALQAVAQGKPALGIKAKNGVVYDFLLRIYANLVDRTENSRMHVFT